MDDVRRKTLEQTRQLPGGRQIHLGSGRERNEIEPFGHAPPQLAIGVRDERRPLSNGAQPVDGQQNLVLAAKARALLDGRTVPTTADIKSIAVPVLRHRIIVNHRAVGDGITAELVVERLVNES